MHYYKPAQVESEWGFKYMCMGTDRVYGEGWSSKYISFFKFILYNDDNDKITTKISFFVTIIISLWTMKPVDIKTLPHYDLAKQVVPINHSH